MNGPKHAGFAANQFLMYPTVSDSIRRPGLDSIGMTSEEPGLLGNLPRSRPGTRSDKRASSAADEELVKEPKRRAKPGATRKPKATAAKAKPAARGKATPKPKSPPAPPPAPPQPAERPREPVASEAQSSGGPLRSVAKVAGTGLRVAEGVTREVLRRLPRP